jgi:hypothetical protein
MTRMAAIGKLTQRSLTADGWHNGRQNAERQIWRWVNATWWLRWRFVNLIDTPRQACSPGTGPVL